MVKHYSDKLRIVDLFTYPTVRTLTRYLSGVIPDTESKRKVSNHQQEQQLASHNQQDIAIIGMAGCFPGAADIKAFWHNLTNGVETISKFTYEELVEKGVDAELLKHKNFVPAAGIIKDIDFFDSHFFGYRPTEADIMDPHHRLFLEVAYQALEQSGYLSDDYSGSIGVFAGMSQSAYFTKYIQENKHLSKSLGSWKGGLATSPEFLATKVFYKLNLRGPSTKYQYGMFDIVSPQSRQLVTIC